MANIGDYYYTNNSGGLLTQYDFEHKGGNIKYWDGKQWVTSQGKPTGVTLKTFVGPVKYRPSTEVDITKDDIANLEEKYGAQGEGGVDEIKTSTVATPKIESPKTDTPKTETPIITKQNNNSPIIQKSNNTLKTNNKPMTNKRKRAIAPDGSTQVGYTQEEFNQRLKDYEMEDQALNERKAQQANLRSQTIGNGNMTRDQLFKDALNKFASNPDGFTAEQRTALYNAGKQLGYYNDTMLDNGTQKPASTVTSQDTAEPTAAGNQIQQQSQSNNNIKQGGGSNFIWYV